MVPISVFHIALKPEILLLFRVFFPVWYLFLVTRKSFELFTSDFDSVLCAGLFSASHMTYRLDRLRSGSSEEPTLADMTEKAIRILRRGNNGYFLLVEGYLM